MERHYKVIAISRDFGDFEFDRNTDVKIIEYDLSNIIGIPKLIAQLGRIDTLANNAGAMLSLPYDNYPQEKVENILKLNIESPVA